jgi:hypothetical protein
MVINDKKNLFFVNVPSTFESFLINISKQLCPSHHTFGNDKIRFDQHIWINLHWNFVAFCLLL